MDTRIDLYLKTLLTEKGLRLVKPISGSQRKWLIEQDSEDFREQLELKVGALGDEKVDLARLLGQMGLFRAFRVGTREKPRYEKRPKTPSRVLQDKLQALTLDELVAKFESGAVGRGEL